MRAAIVCFAVGALCLFLAGYAYAGRDSYNVVGSLHISSDGPERQVCELRIGSATDSKKKLLIVSTMDMQLAQFCRDQAGEHVALTLRVASARTKDTD
jgi:hypothetical protein